MAKFDGIFDIEGTLKGMTFYKTSEGIRIRAKGGISKKRIMNDPAFVRTRENGAEFSHSAKMAQLLRHSVSTLVDNAKDSRTSSRLNQIMGRIKNRDTVNVRGERTVKNGLSDPLALQYLVGFDFNKHSTLSSVLKKSFALNTTDGKLTLSDFINGKQMLLPAGVSKIGFRLGASSIDFSGQTYEFVESPQELMHVELYAPATFTLTLPSIPSSGGLLCFFLLIEFYQEINGVDYPLKNKQFNVLNLIAAS
ncbi:hypothetical protein [Flavobacterium aciduliphilum]|uniref:Uncharacterized protein n=1 Tax=Flavobacterium aciduliphilum TaxID=1101402 RepID=A0A328YJJ2_9FLAO|nr:hypothetical protein [Flavobacterium aciduliphilum]RAR73700.1 hypothetical protein CLV55_10319 [Flavobacterium aciduliphilum]